MRPAAAVLLVPLALGACQRRSAPDGVQAPPSASAAELPPPLATEAAAPAGPTTLWLAMAAFTKDTRLKECDDVDIQAPPGRYVQDAGAADQFLDGFAQSLSKARKDLVRIYRPCDEQFRDRPALASCTIRNSVHLSATDGGDLGTIEITIAGRYYDIDDLTMTDSEMHDCLVGKGDWQGVETSSDAYRQALHGRTRREIERIERALGALPAP